MMLLYAYFVNWFFTYHGLQIQFKSTPLERTVNLLTCFVDWKKYECVFWLLIYIHWITSYYLWLEWLRLEWLLYMMYSCLVYVVIIFFCDWGFDIKRCMLSLLLLFITWEIIEIVEVSTVLADYDLIIVYITAWVNITSGQTSVRNFFGGPHHYGICWYYTLNVFRRKE